MTTRELLVFAVVCGLAAPAAAQGRAKASGVKRGFDASYIGEGGGYAPAGPGLQDAWESGARQEGGHGTFGPLPQAPTPETGASQPAHAGPEHATPGRTSPQAQPETGGQGAFVPRAPAATPEPGRDLDETVDAPRARAESRAGARYSLWDGLSAPLELPSAKIDQVSADKAQALVRRDYDTHILSARRGPDLVVHDAASPAPSAPAPEPEVFVAVDLDLRKSPGDMRDAVAGLAGSAGFRKDDRFEPRYAEPGGERASIWGWIPTARVGDAARRPEVLRLEVGAPARRRPLGAATTVLAGIRVPAGMAPGSEEAALFFRHVAAELSERAGFVWKRTLGVQDVPGGRDRALVVLGDVPVKDMDRLLSHPAVIKVAPAPHDEEAVPAAPLVEPETPESAPQRFLGSVVSKAPWLLAVTGLMLAFRLAAILSVFLPYRRR